MSEVVIKVEGLGKQYRLGMVGTGTLSHDINRFWAKLRGKEDPFLKLGEINDRTVKGVSKYSWALKDVNFEVQQGEILGVIGKNGAGKSTLLKILSRVTGPSVGSIKIKGRLAALLEVGTGFHPELTGRENIFLNGTILGMTRKEVSSKLDEIVDFAGIERYLDTPVKRYSSGMYVRLGFSVAAYLEPDILIVDEVLAVGDVEFQKKCIGKMQDVANKGRTVLFVSHNMASIKNLCTRAILMSKGSLVADGKSDEIIEKYLLECLNDSQDGNVPEGADRLFNTGECFIEEVKLIDNFDKGLKYVHFRENFTIRVRIKVKKKINKALFGIILLNAYLEKVGFLESSKNNLDFLELDEGIHEFTISSNLKLMPGRYMFSATIYAPNGDSYDYLDKVYGFEVLRSSNVPDGEYKWNEAHGYIYEQINLNKIN